jgi:hypothetical protein
MKAKETGRGITLACSAGHKWTDEKMSDRWWRGEKKAGDRCGMELSYDRVAGTRRCRCVLRKISLNTEPKSNE